MAARVGGHPDGLENFTPEDQAVDEWLERLEVFLELQAVTTEADKVNALLHFSGPTVYQVLRQACLPAKPKSKSFEELCNLMRANFESHPLARSFRRKLALRQQKSDESVVQFANALRVLVSKCDYSAAHLETVLVDTFTRNVRSAALQAKFDKAKPEEIATLSKCLELARLYESFEEAKQSRTSDVVCYVSSRGRGGFQRDRGGPPQRGGGSFQSRGGRGGSYGAPSSSRDRGGGAGAAAAPVSSQRGGFQRRPFKCYACGEEGHKAFECRCRNYICSACHQQGHIKKACPTVTVKFVHEEEGDDKHVAGEVEDVSHLMEDVYISKKVFSSDVELENVERYREIVVSKCAEIWDHVGSDEFNVEYEALKWCQEIEADISCCEMKDSVGERLDQDICDVRETMKSARMCDDVVKCVESMQSKECFGQSLLVRMKVNGKDVAMEVDNGSRHSLMTKVRFNRLFPDVQVRNTAVRIASLSGHSLCAGGESRVKVFERGKDWSLRLIICDNNDDFVPLLGREWLDAIVPEWRQMLGFQQISDESKVKSVVNVKDDRISAELEQLKIKYPSVFSEDGSSCIEGFTASVVLKPNARPVFHKEYVVPYSEREKVTTVLRNKIQDGRYVRVERAVWASPVWPVPKPHSGETRVVHDYKRTVNPNIVVDHYPLPLPIDIFNAMRDCKYYCVLDCADAFMQLKLDEASQEILVLNTCIGLLKPTRLPYGLSSASACFQSVIDQVLADLPRVRAYIDDIIVGGESLEVCRKNLYGALSRLEKHKVRVRFDKMQLYRTEIEILGYVLGFNVYRASPKKVSAIVNCAKPKNQGEVHSYLGMINFYARFLPNASSLFKPLYDLLLKDARWEWDENCEKAFELSKTMLIESKALVLYDPTKELVLMTDASPVGVGGVLSMKVGNQELPIEFMSKMLTITQQRYSQLEREALAIIIALQKYHKYLWGRKFKIITDNMPLKAMFAPTKTTPKVAAQRLQRWSVILGNYDYEIEYRKSSQMGPADMLSRLPVNEYAFDEVCNFVVDLPELPVSCESVMVETESDPQLSAVKMYVMKGWPDVCPAADLKVYFDVRYALSVESDCIMLGDRVVVPPCLQKKVLENLHQGHPGIVRMKLRARSLMWWPNITMDIENYVADCAPCSQNNFKAASVAQVPWTPTSQPWERIHIDFFFLTGDPYLLCVDSFSKWVEVWKMVKTNATAVIEKLSLCFSTWGLPLEIVSDNGPPFNSVEFIDFCTRNLIVVSKSAPYHPQGNGQGEKFVGTVKMGLKKLLSKSDGVPLPIKLSNYLLAIRTTPSTVTRKCPSDLMLGFEPKTLVNAIKPNLRKYVPRKQHFQVGDIVKVKLSQKHEVFLAKIIKVAGPTLYHVEVCDGDKIYQVSVNQLQLNGSNVKIETDKSDMDVVTPVVPKTPPVPDVLVPEQSVPDQVSVIDVPDLQVADESVPLRDQPPSPGRAAVTSPKPPGTPSRVLRDRRNIRLPPKLRSGEFHLYK